ncbi:putative MFS sugar transporter [Gymnopus androsaceus JB14]|uniref:MFS sugar transporter n=1 Tax=Gymnopus androsaceus JB14 TaxID=1447944 RepID=A0A6A4H318_9AGAR|nr:putative MFS sugar transporter [Gymnopus androsaceus JB14]
MEDKATHWRNNTHPNWWMDPGLRKSTVWVVLLYFGCFVIGYDGSLMNGFQAMPHWNKTFNNPSGTRLGLITASLYFAQIPTTVLIPWICDTYGRRTSIVLGSIGIIAGALITCFSQNEAMFISGRVVIGLFCDFPLIACSCLINELVHPRLRGISAGLFMITYNFGSLIAAWVTFVCILWDSDWSWRLPALFQAVGPVILVFVGLICPESPRYLISRGNENQAMKILAKYHANGDHDDELVQREFQEISMHIRQEKENSVGSWRSLIATPGNRHRLLIMCIVSSGIIITGIGPIASYLPPVLRSVGITDPIKISIINGGLAIFNTFMSVVGGLCVDRIGRRSLFLISTIGMLVTYTVIIGLAASFTSTPDPSPAIGIAFVVMFFLCYGSYDIAWVPLAQLYNVEILPFSIRSKALSVGNVVTTICLSISNFVNPIGLERLHWRFYTVFLAIQFIYLALIWWFFIETRGHTIEQVSVLFDKEPVIHSRPNPIEQD